jgi:uncharacterized protein (DUF433 family)
MWITMCSMEFTGAYSADRAAALSGVPKSTVYYWARKGHLVPSISKTSLKLWSFKDLLGLRTIYWLRQPKKAFEIEIPSTSMQQVKRALAEISRLDLELIESGRPVVAVTRFGEIVIDSVAAPLQLVNGEYLEREIIDLIAPFPVMEGGKGPHLHAPRELLRIVPGKLGGAPHVQGTRVESESLFALARRGFTVEHLGRVYPFVSPEAIAQSLELERQLQFNLAVKRAA